MIVFYDYIKDFDSLISNSLHKASPLKKEYFLIRVTSYGIYTIFYSFLKVKILHVVKQIDQNAIIQAF